MQVEVVCVLFFPDNKTELHAATIVCCVWFPDNVMPHISSPAKLGAMHLLMNSFKNNCNGVFFLIKHAK
jgi:hypothetical protein